MGKRTKQYYKMMEQFQNYLNQAAQPNEWETALGNEVRKRMSRSSGDIMADNLGTLASWQRRYKAGMMPETSVRNKGYQVALANANNLGAEELARDYGALGEQSVRNYRNDTLGLLGNQQGIASNRMATAMQGALGGAQMWNNFRPKKGWFDTIVGGASQIARLAFNPGGFGSSGGGTLWNPGG